jgi:hypothetical protein
MTCRAFPLYYRLLVTVICSFQLSAYEAFSSENIFFKLFCYIILAMSQLNTVRKLINLGIKKEIISTRESGKHLGDLSAAFGMAKSTISTILKNKEEIKREQVANGISRLSSSMVILL